jgi:hypothetical protein
VAENLWSLNVGGLPAGLDQEFSTPALPLLWGFYDSAPVPLAMAFEPEALPWTLIYWTPAELLFNLADPPPVGGTLLLRMLMGVGR